MFKCAIYILAFYGAAKLIYEAVSCFIPKHDNRVQTYDQLSRAERKKLFRVIRRDYGKVINLEEYRKGGR